MGIEWLRPGKGHRMVMWMLGWRERGGTKAARIPVSIDVTIDAASYREAPVGDM
jgi:hypothetical protein